MLPDTWDPERWLEGPAAAKYRDDDKAALQPFSLGPRGCIGKRRVTFFTNIEGRGGSRKQSLMPLLQSGLLRVAIHPNTCALAFRYATQRTEPRVDGPEGVCDVGQAAAMGQTRAQGNRRKPLKACSAK